MEVTGTVKSIIFRNAENGYSVLEFVDASGDEITAVGQMPLANVGERVELTGDWIEHRVYGIQFRAASCRILAPASLAALISYLSSGLIRGVGKATAESIASAFGMDALSVMENEPERLSEVPGIGRVRAQTIAASYAEQRTMRDMMLSLMEYGITVTQCVKIHRVYGSLALARIHENPYRLIDDIDGIGFITADRIALAAGIEHDSEFRIAAGIKYTLLWASEEGHTFLPEEKLVTVAADQLKVEVAAVERTLEGLILRGALIQKAVGGTNAIFLERMYRLESECAARLARLARPVITNPFWDFEAMITRLEARFSIGLAGAQREAIVRAMTSGAMVITGGPGTGKTTILRFIIGMMDELGLDYELSAPTGRAAKRMAEATGVAARTIHRLLEYSPDAGTFLRNAENPILCDMIIVDEMSMVDVALMAALLKATAAETRLVMVGDADQLPPVGPGNVLRDIIASGAVRVVRLEEIFRQAERGMIVENAHRINNGRMIELDVREGDFVFDEMDAAEQIIRRLTGICLGRVPRLMTRDPMRDVQVLSPMRKGALGVINLNARLQAALNPKAPNKRERQRGETVFREGDKVMQIKNNYKTAWSKPATFGAAETGSGVFNGDFGTIMRIDDEEQAVEVLFDDERAALYDFTMLDELELAYAVTVHKGQGSEFPVVVLPLLSGPPTLFTRNLLYTAVSRAREQVYLIGRRQCVRAMIDNADVKRRYSALGVFLADIADLLGDGP